MKKVFDGKHIYVFERDGWEYVERKTAKEAVAIVAVADGKLILTEQYRRPVDARVIDLPAGLIEEHGPEETAKRELDEETGYVCDRVELLIKAPTSPGITSEIVQYYRAINPRKKGKGGGVGGEDITVHTIAVAELEQWLKKQKSLVDGKVWTAVHFIA
ncbi:MAG TPA: NUDIX hydrolase [Thermoanaerobaculia bacterium]|nr:NUDIX hydrolase [Thermoanaerobaculia bacterium]